LPYPNNGCKRLPCLLKIPTWVIGLLQKRLPFLQAKHNHFLISQCRAASGAGGRSFITLCERAGKDPMACVFF
jgi:hypothetical protein